MLGQALRYAFNSTQGDYVAVMDCDLSYEPEHLGRMLYAIQDSAGPHRDRVAVREGRQDHQHPVRPRSVLSRAANWMLSQRRGRGHHHRHRDGARLRRPVPPQPRPAGDGHRDQHRDHLQGADPPRPDRRDPRAPRLVVRTDRRARAASPRTSASRAARCRRCSRPSSSGPSSSSCSRACSSASLSAYSLFWCVWHVFQVWGAPSTFGNSGLTGAIEDAYSPGAARSSSSPASPRCCRSS